MSRPVHSTQLGGAHVTGTGFTPIYTCPVGKRTIVKWFSATDLSGGINDLGCMIDTGISFDFNIFRQVANPAYSTIGGFCWVVMNAGDKLVVFHGTGAGTGIASGVELDLP